MRSFILLCILDAIALHAEIIHYQPRGVSSTQAIVSFIVADPAQCTIVAYNDPSHTQPAYDSDPTLFARAAACDRPGNLIDGKQVTAVLGQRTVEMAMDDRTYSRALAQGSPYWVRITDTEDGAVLDVELTTAVVPWGQTWNDPLPTLIPWLSATDSTQVVIDPQTGVALHRFTLASDFQYEQALKFGSPSTPIGWENAANMTSSDSTASVTRSISAVFIPDTDSSVAGNGGSHGRAYASSGDAANGFNQISVSMRAWCSDSACSLAQSDDSALQVALSVDGGMTPATNWRDIATSYCSSGCGTGQEITVDGTGAYLSDWISTPLPPFDVTALPMRSGGFIASGNVVKWSAGSYYFPTRLSPGATVHLNGVANTIASIDTDRQITLTANATSASGTWSISPFGLLVRKKTASANIIQVQAVSAKLNFGQSASWGTTSSLSSCSAVPVSGPTGEGVHCWQYPGIYWLNTSTGQRTLIAFANLPYNPASDGWPQQVCTALAWDARDGNRFTCYLGNGWNVVVGLEYRGSNADIGPQMIRANSPVMPNCATSSPPCFAMTNLAPASQNKTLLQQFSAFNAGTAAFAAQYGVNLEFGTIEGPLLEFQALRQVPTQMTHIHTRSFSTRIARRSFVPRPSRWSGIHGAGTSGLPTGFAVIPDQGFAGPLSGRDIDANGPFVALVERALSSTATIPCPTWDPSSGIAQTDWPVGNICAVLTTNGQPYDPSPGPHEPGGQSISAIREVITVTALLPETYSVSPAPAARTTD